jgi:exosortase/archaeosortase family protein
MKKKNTKSKQPKFNKSPKLSIRRFLITYLLLMAAFFFVIGFTPLQKIIDVNGLYTRGVVLITSEILSTLHVPTTCDGSIIHLPSIALDVRFGCNGLEAVMIYSVAVLAFPAPWRKKIYGIIAGFLIIQIINIIRIVGLAYAGVYFQNIFHYIHIYVAQGIMIAIALGTFFLYLAFTKTDGKAVA